MKTTTTTSALLLFLALALALALAALPSTAAAGHADDRQQQQQQFPSYAVLIDAGSSGSRVHVYRYLPPPAPGQYAAVHLPSTQLKIEGGLSAYAPDGEGAGTSLIPLVEFAKQQIPPASWPHTPLLLLATAGLRLLPRNQSSAILDNCRSVLALSGLAFDSAGARLLPGSLEGLYAWAGVNYASGALQALANRSQPHSLHHQLQGPPPPPLALALEPGLEPVQTWGVFELGGASLQVTFIAEERLPPKAGHVLTLPGLHGLPLFTHSFLGYGLDTAFLRASRMVQQHASTGSTGSTIRDPCLLTGFTGPSGLSGSGSFSACLSVAQQLLHRPASCPFKQCTIGGEYLPKLSGLHLAVANFFHIAQRLELPTRASLSELAAAGARFCNKTWDQVEEEYVRGKHMPREYLSKTCFGAAYIFLLLRDAFHVPPEGRHLSFTNTVHRAAGGGAAVQANWVLGALLVEVIHAAPTTPATPPTPTHGARQGPGPGSGGADVPSPSAEADVTRPSAGVAAPSALAPPAAQQQQQLLSPLRSYVPSLLFLLAAAGLMATLAISGPQQPLPGGGDESSSDAGACVHAPIMSQPQLQPQGLSLDLERTPREAEFRV